jgi:hypothetical protein
MSSPQWNRWTERNIGKARKVLTKRRNNRKIHQRAILLLASRKTSVALAVFREDIWPFLSEKLPSAVGPYYHAISLWVHGFLRGVDYSMLIQYHSKCLEILKGERRLPDSGNVRCACAVDGQTFIWNPGF